MNNIKNINKCENIIKNMVAYSMALKKKMDKYNNMDLAKKYESIVCKPEIIPKDIKFQVLDWNYYHEEEDQDTKFYTIRLFGRTDENKTIYVKVNKYTPYFYVELNDKWKNKNVEELINVIKAKVRPAQNVGGLIDYKIIYKYKMWGFTNYKKTPFLQLVFNDSESMRSYEFAFRQNVFVHSISPKLFKLKLYESNIEPFLRCMHIRKLEAVGWITIPDGKYEVIDNSTTCCAINISADWTELNPIDDRKIMPFTIASFDIECISEDGSFPQAERDNDTITQIGTTFSRYGESECYYKHIITLDTCDPVDGVVVESYKTETQLLLAWTKMIKRMNPDIVVGYNIFGFDFKYMKDRATKLGIYNAFSKLSRVNEEITKFKDTKLASSAMGVNLLHYYDMTGRVIIDMMKVLQRDYKLDSYKLDFAASSFIKESIISATHNNNTTHIVTKNVYGINKDQFITVFYNDGITLNKHMDGKKFRIIRFEKTLIKEKDKKTGEMKDVTGEVIVVDGLIETDIMSKKYKEVFWCHAKDDISPHDIFRLQRGTSKDRAIIAKYCIQDCELVSKLIDKLQIITNTVGMATVCHVPISYLFMRGQGVKIQSLTLKKCREKNHLFPTLRPKKKPVDADGNLIDKDELTEQQLFQKFIDDLNNKGTKKVADDEDGDDDGTYDGAIVFIPKVGLHVEPIVVLDYASLYPSAMILQNLSHECYVIDDETYGNLPGYKYNIITYVTSKIIEEVDKKQKKFSYQVFAKRKQEVVESYKQKLMIIEEKEDIGDMGQKQYVTQIFDKDKNNKKRYLTAEIIIDEFEFRLNKYETSKFAEKLDGSKGILPEILQDLLSARKKYKKEMENEPDPFKKGILDGLQLAYKVTANSLYGQTGASTSPICLKQIAASTTATGREALYISKRFIENNFGTMVNYALEDKTKYMNYITGFYKNTSDKQFMKPNKDHPEEGWNNRNEFFELFYKKMNALMEGYSIKPDVIYGDSVTPDTPVLLRKKDGDKYIVEIKTIETIGNIWQSYNQFKSEQTGLTDKQQDDNVSYEVWTDKGWSKINRVIRHKTNKKLYEVLTHTGCVRVTEDHSLLTKDGVQIKPKDVKIGTELLHAFPTIDNNTIDQLSTDKAYIYGFFFGGGSCGKYGSGTTTKYSWALNSNNMVECTKLKIKLEKEYKKTFKILDTLESSGVYKVVPCHDNIKDYITEYQDIFYDKDKLKIIPPCVLNGSKKDKESFLEGYHAFDGYRKDTKVSNCHRFDVNGQISGMNMYYLVRALGYNASINKRLDKPEIFRITYITGPFRKAHNKVKKLREIGMSNDYVYDLETVVGHFHAGVGQMIVKNTDSVFFCANITDNKTGEKQKDRNALIMAMQLGVWASHTICAYLTPPMAQSYEKTMWPLALVSKKRYVGNLYETDPDKCYQKSMGIVMKRRDNANIVKVVCGGIIEHMINKQDIKGAVKFTQRTLKDILCGKYPIDKFIISKTLRDTYADRTRMVHAVLADRMAARDPGNKPMSNDRIPFAYIVTKGEVKLQGERVEHPDYIQKNKLQLDYLFYITNQIMKPCIQFLELLVENAESIFTEYITREENRRLGKKTIKHFIDKNTDPQDEENEMQIVNFDKPLSQEDILIATEKKPRTKPKRKPKMKEMIDDKIIENENGDGFEIEF